MTRARDVADAGHATTATTADTISQKTSINLSGTYSTHQLLVADAYNFAGDLTVNDNLILGKISDDGNDLVLEGSHTLQGTGQLEAGYVSSSGIGSVDGMTGTLGSGITLGSGATIDSGVTGTLGSSITPPAGTTMYITHQARRGTGSVGDQTNWYPVSSADLSTMTLYLAISSTQHAAFSKLKIEWVHDMRFNKDSHAHIDWRIVRWQNSSTAPTTTHGGETSLFLGTSGVVAGGSEVYDICGGAVIDDITGLSGEIKYALQYRNAAGSASYASTMYDGNALSRHQMIISGII